MKIKFNVDPNLSEEKAGFWLKKMTEKSKRLKTKYIEKAALF